MKMTAVLGGVLWLRDAGQHVGHGLAAMATEQRLSEATKKLHPAAARLRMPPRRGVWSQIFSPGPVATLFGKKKRSLGPASSKRGTRDPARGRDWPAFMLVGASGWREAPN